MTENLKQFVKRPDSLFFLAALLTMAIPLFLWGESVVIDFWGYTILIGGKEIIYIIAIFLVSNWIAYRILSRYLVNNLLIWFHILITITVIAHFLFTGFWYSKTNVTSDAQAFIYGSLMNNRTRMVSIMSVPAIIFITGQVTFVIYLMIVLKKRKSVK
jgi:hypothetical protein